MVGEWAGQLVDHWVEQMVGWRVVHSAESMVD